jgi:hypothetical protein
VAGFAGTLRQVEYGLQALSRLGKGRCFQEFKRIAMRSDKTDKSFQAMIYLCSAVINSQ